MLIAASIPGRLASHSFNVSMLADKVIDLTECSGMGYTERFIFNRY
jgi:hypothetical protein